jgi:hypothetical protein
MSDPMKQAWNDVAEGFSTLGRMMKERYETASAEEAGDAAAAASAQNDRAAVRDAFDRLITAGREFGDRAVDVARDDDVKAQAKRAAASLNDAVSATVELIGEQVGGLFNRTKDDDPTPEAPTSEALPTKPADDG